MRLPLVGGSYTSRSIIASAQRCVNLYPEVNRKDAIVPVTHYQRPGLVPRLELGTGPVRGLYRASNDRGFVVSGSDFYMINPDWSTKHLGTITQGLTTPVSMIDTGGAGALGTQGTLVLVDGSAAGWTYDLSGGTFAQINDPTGTFQGASRVDYIDGFIIYNFIDSPFFGSTLNNVVQFDGTYYFGKTDYPDNIQTIIVNRHEILVIGVLTTEIWYDAGSNPPFAELPGAFVNHGTIAKYSVAQQDIATYWLGQNREGAGQVMRHRAYKVERISNHALEDAVRKMLKGPGVSDAIGYCYQQDGHVFYVLHFPKGNQTGVFDEAVADPTMAWHQDAWTDPATGELHRHRGNCHAFINGVNLVGDWQNGTIYEMDLDTYTDTVAGLEGPCTYIRTFPHIGSAGVQGGRAEIDGRRLQFSAFRADIECGMGPTSLDHLPAQVSLRWSDDRGRTFGQAVLQSNGQPGEYLTQPQWIGLGIARDRIFELSYSIAGSAALNGAWVDAEVLTT